MSVRAASVDSVAGVIYAQDRGGVGFIRVGWPELPGRVSAQLPDRAGV